MLNDAFHRIDTSQLYPPYLLRLRTLDQNLRNRGVAFFATSGTRWEAEQNKLYAQGRTTPGPIVTNAKFGQSAHSFGIGTDWTHDLDNNPLNGLQPDWNKGPYGILAEEATKINLEAGFYWKGFPDLPHIQLPLGKHGLLLFPDPKQPHAIDLLTTYQHGGHPAVWKLLDQYQWW